MSFASNGRSPGSSRGTSSRASSPSRVKETQALIETARANYESIELQVRLEVEQAYIAVVEADERIGATEKAIESARRTSGWRRAATTRESGPSWS